MEGRNRSAVPEASERAKRMRTDKTKLEKIQQGNEEGSPTPEGYSDLRRLEQGWIPHPVSLTEEGGKQERDQKRTEGRMEGFFKVVGVCFKKFPSCHIVKTTYRKHRLLNVV